MASALEYAHGQGVIHRDIKPENILLHGGHALVADFGIALAATSAGSRMTETGMSLGTPTYMSPEQAMGERALDDRSDVYALGCVLYEMLVGAPPFTGPTAQAIVAKVITEKPVPPSATRDTVPDFIDHAVLTALAKLPADRFATAREFASALAGEMVPRPGGRTRGLRPRPADRPTVRLLAVALLAAAAVAVWDLIRARSGPFDVGLPPEAPIGSYAGFAVAPDESFIVYPVSTGDRSELWYRTLRGTDARAVPGTEGAYGAPWISADGRQVAFTAGERLRVINLAGGPATDAANVTLPTGGEWRADGTIFFAHGDGRHFRWVTPAAGAGLEQPAPYCILPHRMGRGGLILCGGGAEKYGTVVDSANSTRKRPWRRAEAGDSSVVAGSDFRVVAERYVVYLSLDGTLMGTRIVDPEALTVGRSVPLVPSVRRRAYTGAGDFHVTASGTLIYAPGRNGDVGRLVRLDRDGRVTPLPLDVAPFLRFSPSPDGRRLAGVIEGVEQQELRLYDLESGRHDVLERGFFIGTPAWSPDGRRLAYRRDASLGREMLAVRRLDASNAPVVLLAPPAPLAMQASTWASDDALLVGSAAGPAMIINPDVDPPRVDSLPFSAFHLSFSPGRRWLVWQTTGLAGLQILAWPSRDRRYQVDPVGYEGRWRSATELVYLGPASGGRQNEATLWQATVTGDLGSPVIRTGILQEDPRLRDTPGFSFAFLPGGDVVYLQSAEDDRAHYVRVIPGWVKQMTKAVDAVIR